jgi:small-conductance mechanosensitive channel
MAEKQTPKQETKKDKNDEEDKVEDKNKVEEGENNEDKNGEEEKKEEPEIDKKGEIVSDIIANNPLNPGQEEQEEEEIRAFTKKNVIEEVHFSWFYLNDYLDWYFQNIPETLRVIAECIIISIIFLSLPVILLYIKKGGKATKEVLKSILDGGTRKDPVDNFLMIYLFITCIYVLNSIVSLISDNILYICLSILEFFNVEINEFTIQFLQIIKATNYYWRTSLICFLIFMAYNHLLSEYQWFLSSYETSHVMLTFLLWYGCLMAILFVEKFFLNFCTSEIRRREYRGRIWDINYKTFVFKKLVALSKADPRDRENLATEMVNDFDPGFYIKHNDIKLSSEKDAIDLVESIFAYLVVQHITYDDIKKYFPENPKEVYEYLANKKISGEDKKEILKFERISDEAVKLQQERNDMMRTLIDRESIFDKLDLILMSAGLYAGLLLLLVLFGIPYQIYLASIGPIFFTFGWIFSDTIKEIYNCFVFLLVKHPYDVGDRVVIDDKEYVVSKTDVLASTFLDENGKIVYIPTPILFGKTICNMRRSRRQSESLTLLIDQSTKFTQAIDLRDKIRKSLKQIKNSFTGEVTIRSFELVGGNIALTLVIQHTSNFQQANEKLKRREVCTDIVQKALSSSGIKYNNSFGYTT